MTPLDYAARADLLIDNVQIVDVLCGTLRKGCVAVKDGRILGYARREADRIYDGDGRFLIPGLIDSHVHIESSMLSPAGFAAMLLPLGTTTVVADPHEMTNVSGEEAVLGLIDAARHLPLSIKVMVPSCVPALPFEDSGAVLTSEDVKRLLPFPEVLGLGEMMNFPGVLSGDDEVMAKIRATREIGKTIDGHAPMLAGLELETYAAAGIKTDHECSTPAELKDRISLGMYAAIRQGSAARNLLPLVPGIAPQLKRRCLLCTDDRHAADTLENGHIAAIAAMAVKAGINPIEAVRMASLNTAECYDMHDRGAIAPGRRADLVLVEDLIDFKVKAVWTEGNLVAEDGRLTIETPVDAPNFLRDTVHIQPVTAANFALKIPSGRARMIGILPHDLTTVEKTTEVKVREDGSMHLADNPGMIKIAVVERHRATGKTGVALFDPAYGLKGGAIATSISHDSHNIVVAGDSEADMAIAVNRVAQIEGGIVMVKDGRVTAELALPVAGLMSDKSPEEVAAKIRELTALAHDTFGITKEADAFMTLSFMALPVIPYLKLTARGLFDVMKFKFVSSDLTEDDRSPEPAEDARS